MVVPSALAPWTSALAPMAREVRVVSVVVKRILRSTEMQEVDL